MDFQPDRLATIIEQRCKDKPLVNYSKDIDSWNFINKKIIDIIYTIDNNDPARIYHVSVTEHILRVEYATVRDLETSYRHILVCDASYLGMDDYEIRKDWESLQADLEAQQKEIEREQARGARYRYYLRLRAEFDPDFEPPEDY